MMDGSVFVGIHTIKLIAQAGVDFTVIAEAAITYAKQETHLPTSPVVQFDFSGYTFEVDEHTDVAKFVRDNKALLRKNKAAH